MSDKDHKQALEKQGVAIALTDPRLIFCDSAFLELQPNEEVFILTPTSGGGGISRIAFTPAHLKRLNLLLTQKVSEFEEKNGEINTELPTND